MKKLSAVLILFLLTALSAFATERSGTDYAGDYIIESTGRSENAKITGYIGSKAEIRIPYIINRMTIIAIGDRVFYDRKLTKVVIPNNVILIGNEAFARNEITSITIGANVSMNANSFSSGFANFYSNNGQRAGTYILSNGAWSFQIFIEPPDEAIPDKKPETKNISGVEFDVYGSLTISIGLWDYGPSTFIPRPSLYFGASMKTNKLEAFLSAGVGGFIGITYPEFDDFGNMYGYFFGTSIEFFFPNDFGLGLGCGMTKFNFTTMNNNGKNSFFPYVELFLMFGERDDSIGPFIRYYFNDDNFYNKFSVGIRIGDFI